MGQKSSLPRSKTYRIPNHCSHTKLAPVLLDSQGLTQEVKLPLSLVQRIVLSLSRVTVQASSPQAVLASPLDRKLLDILSLADPGVALFPPCCEMFVTPHLSTAGLLVNDPATQIFTTPYYQRPRFQSSEQLSEVERSVSKAACRERKVLSEND